MMPFIEQLMGVDTLTDQVVVMDLLMSTKSAITMYSMAATEAATPEVRATFVKHLEEALDTHEKVYAYMMQRGFYHPYNIQEQIQLDRKNIETALSIPG